MTAEEAIEIGMQIAQRHEKNVRELIAMGSTATGALNGCVVSLAGDIMVALQEAATSAESVRSE
jgi:hypothetical protein